MECKVTCFERVMYLVKPLPEDKLKEAVEIIQEDSFQDLYEKHRNVEKRLGIIPGLFLYANQLILLTKAPNECIIEIERKEETI